MPKRKVIARLGEQVFTRTTDRDYKFVLVEALKLKAECDKLHDMLERALPYVEEGEEFNKPSCRGLSKEIRAALPPPERRQGMKAYEMVVGCRYNWKGQADRLIYIGKEGRWHQFERVGEPNKVWCEVLDSDLQYIEVTTQPSQTPRSDAEHYYSGPDAANYGIRDPDSVVDYEFAQQLERELHVALRQRDELLAAARDVLGNKRGEGDWLILSVHAQALEDTVSKIEGELA